MTPGRPALPVRWRVFGTAVAGFLAITLWLRVTAAPPVPPPPPRAPNSIAIMPFINASPDSSYDYLSQGISRDLTSALGRIPGFQVAAERSAAALSDNNPASIGRRLGVGTVLLGSVRPVGDRLRVSAHLVSVAGGFDVWSEAYERSEANFLSVESDIFGAIVAALRLRDPRGGKLPPAAEFRTSPSAHAAYLRARLTLDRAPPGSGEVAQTAFDQAIALDSNYAPSWAGVAEANVRAFLAEWAPPEEAVPFAREAAERAVGLDSTMAPARLIRAIIWLLYDREPGKAARELERAIALNPNLPDGYDWEAHRLLAVGQRDSALAAARRAVETSPFDAVLRAHLAWQYLLAKDDSLAAVAFARAFALDSPRVALDAHMAWRTVLPADSGRTYDSLVLAAKARYVSPYTLAVAALAAGKPAQATTALARAIAERTPWVMYARLDPRLEALRGTRPFETLLARLPQTTIPSRPRPSVPQSSPP
jgi:TolB-like protein